jgi:hypothetical protein
MVWSTQDNKIAPLGDVNGAAAVYQPERRRA